MTETTETTQEATESTETAENAEPVDNGGSDNPNREAAKFRRQLREAEAERDALAERVTAMQKADVERVAGEHLRNPQGLWAAGVEVADLLDNDGLPDADKIADAAKTAAEALGLARPLGGNYVPSEGDNARPSSGSGWSAAFGPKA